MPVNFERNFQILENDPFLRVFLQDGIYYLGDAVTIWSDTSQNEGVSVPELTLTYAELSTDMPDFTNVFVSDVPANIGSMWSKLSGVWRPTTGILNYAAHVGSLVEIPSSQQDQTLFNIPVTANILPNTAYGSFMAIIGISTILEAPISFNLKINGKHYSSGVDTDTLVVFTIPAGELYCQINVYPQTFNYVIPEQPVKKRIHLGTKGYTDVLSSQPWSIKLVPVNPLPEGLVLSLYQYALSFIYF